MAHRWRRYAALGALVTAVCMLPSPAGARPAPRTTPPVTNSCSGQQIRNPGFETGTAAPWTAPAGVVSDDPGEPAHSGNWDAWLGDGAGINQTLSQSITIPPGCHAILTFWLHIDTAETTTTVAYDRLAIKTGTTTLATYSNLNHNMGYSFKSMVLPVGTTSISFVVTEDATLPTCFVIDDVQVTLS